MKLLTSNQAAAILGIGTDTLRRYATKDRKIPYFRTGTGAAHSRIMFDEADVISFRDGQFVQVGPKHEAVRRVR